MVDNFASLTLWLNVSPRVVGQELKKYINPITNRLYTRCMAHSKKPVSIVVCIWRI